MATHTASIGEFSPAHLTLSEIQGKNKGIEGEESGGEMSGVYVNDGVCAICLDNIELQETALVKGCEHAYCVGCILQWTTYHEHPKCPKCKHPFESLGVHRALDGSLRDYLVDESVCLLVRASWFKPLVFDHQDDPHDDLDNIYLYQYEYEYGYGHEEEEDVDEVYFDNSSTLRIGNRRWGDNGYVRAGRQEAKPMVHKSNPNTSGSGSSSRQSKKKQVEGVPENGTSAKELIGRRAKRALKREAANKVAGDEQA